MQLFSWKFVQRSTFGRLKSANGHILDRLFPNLWQIPKIHPAYMVGIRQELHYHQRYVLSNAVLLLKIGENVQFWSVKISEWVHFG